MADNCGKWHKDYFDLKIFKKQKVQEDAINFHFLP